MPGWSYHIVQERGGRCESCGLEEEPGEFGYRKLVVHHRDQNRKNNESSNLRVLCRSCHQDPRTHSFFFMWLRDKEVFFDRLEEMIANYRD